MSQKSDHIKQLSIPFTNLFLLLQYELLLKPSVLWRC